MINFRVWSYFSLDLLIEDGNFWFLLSPVEFVLKPFPLPFERSKHDEKVKVMVKIWTPSSMERDLGYELSSLGVVQILVYALNVKIKKLQFIKVFYITIIPVRFHVILRKLRIRVIDVKGKLSAKGSRTSDCSSTSWMKFIVMHTPDM